MIEVHLVPGRTVIRPQSTHGRTFSSRRNFYGALLTSAYPSDLKGSDSARSTVDVSCPRWLGRSHQVTLMQVELCGLLKKVKIRHRCY